MNKLNDFKGKIITIGRKSGPEYANDFLFPQGVRKEIAYVDNKCHLNYVNGLYEDNSACYMGGMLSGLDNDVKKNYNIAYIREANEDELAVYIKEVQSYFDAVSEDKGRPPFAMFPLPIIDKIKMGKKWRKIFIEEQNKG